MRNDFESNYLAHSARGTTWKNVKYIQKVKGPNGKYIYFYTQQAYDAYMRRFAPEGRNAKANPKELPKEAIDKKNLISNVKPVVKTIEQKKQETANLIVAGKKAANAPALGQRAAQLKMKQAAELSTAGKAKADEIIAKAKEGNTEDKKKSGSSKKSGSESSKKSGSSKKRGSSGKSGGSGSSKKAGGSSKEKSGSTKQKKSSKSGQSSSKKTTSTKGEQPTVVESKGETHKYSSSKEMLERMKKYEEGSFGYLKAGNTTYKWEKQNGKIILIDTETNEEVSINEYLKDATSIEEYEVKWKSKYRK